VSLCSRLSEAVALANAKVEALVRRQLFNRTPRQVNQTLYVWELHAQTVLPTNIHVSRDTEYVSPERVPHGHHTINLCMGGMTGQDFVNALEKVDKTVMEKGYNHRLDYQVVVNRKGEVVWLRGVLLIAIRLFLFGDGRKLIFDGEKGERSVLMISDPKVIISDHA
jgi:hypothetical protein